MEEIEYIILSRIKKYTGKPGYFISTVVGILIVIAGTMMNVVGRTSSIDIGLKYGPTEPSSISGNLVIIPGIIILGAILVFYLRERNKKP